MQHILSGADGVEPAPSRTFRPDALTLARDEQTWTGGELSRWVEAHAASLREAGLRPGDVLLGATDDPLELIRLQLALARIGAGLLPVPMALAPSEVATLAADVGAEWLWQAGRVAPSGLVRPDPGPTAHASAAPTLLIRTSGSGGRPRVVMLSRARLLASAERVNTALDLRPGDQWLCVLPLHHIGGMAILWRCLLAGAAVRLLPAGLDPDQLGLDQPTSALVSPRPYPSLRQANPCRPGCRLAGHGPSRPECRPPGRHIGAQTASGLLRPGASSFDPERLADALRRHPVTHLSLVPPMLSRLLAVMPRPPESLRVLLLGGQALHPALARRAADAGWPLYVSYGMSETGSMIAVGPWRDDEAPGARVGAPLPGVELDCAGPDEPPRVLRLRGPMVMTGYASPARDAGAGLTDGWLDTADLAALDGDGVLRIFGRADDQLVIGGEQVRPADVEAALAAVAGVEDVVVIGLDHPTWGATLAACWSGPATPAALEQWCRDSLPSRQRPRVFRHLDALPRLASGKPDRAALKRSA